MKTYSIFRKKNESLTFCEGNLQPISGNGKTIPSGKLLLRFTSSKKTANIIWNLVKEQVIK